MAIPLHQLERIENRLKLDCDDIDTIEEALGYCLVGCFTGHNSGRAGVVTVANQWCIPYQFHLHQSV